MAQINYQPFDTKDFAAILQHLKFRSKQSNPYDLDSLSDMSEYAYDFIDHLNEVTGTTLSFDPTEADTLGFIYSLVWFDRFSARICENTASIETLMLEATQATSKDINAIVTHLNNDRSSVQLSYMQTMRVYDYLHEKLIDGNNLLRIMEGTSGEFFIYFTDRLECATRILRYLDWCYFSHNHSYAD